MIESMSMLWNQYRTTNLFLLVATHRPRSSFTGRLLGRKRHADHKLFSRGLSSWRLSSCLHPEPDGDVRNVNMICFRIVDSSGINNNRLAHPFPEVGRSEFLEFVPLGHYERCVSVP